MPGSITASMMQKYFVSEMDVVQDGVGGGVDTSMPSTSPGYFEADLDIKGLPIADDSEIAESGEVTGGMEKSCHVR